MKAFYNKAIMLLSILFISLAVNAQIKFGDNKTTINTASLLELETTNKGILFPRVSLTTTTTWTLTGTNIAAMMVYNTNTGITSSNTSYPVITGGKGMYYWDGTGWVGMTYPLGLPNGQFWALKGNSGTTASTSAIGVTANNNFMGTTDAKDLVFATNSLERIRVTSAGLIGVNKSVPAALIDMLDGSGQQTLVNAVGNVNNYLQLNIQNSSTGNGASGDLVVTADNGSASTHYIDLGINSSGYNQNNWGYANGAYLYASDDTLRIGTQAAGKPLIFNTAGAVNANERMRIDPAGNVGIGTTNPLQKLHISGAYSSSAIGSTGTYLVTPTVRIDGLNTTNNPGVHGSDAEPKAVYATTNGDLVLVPSDSILVSNDDFIPNGSPITLNVAPSGTGILVASAQLYTTNFTLGRRALVQLNYSVDLIVTDYNGGVIADGSARLMQSWMNIINTAGPVTVKSVVGNSSSTFTSSLGTGTVVSGILYNNGAYTLELPAGTYTLQIYGDVYTGNGKGARVIYGSYSLDEIQIIAHYK